MENFNRQGFVEQVEDANRLVKEARLTKAEVETNISEFMSMLMDADKLLKTAEQLLVETERTLAAYNVFYEK